MAINTSFDLLDILLSQDGDTYLFGHEVSIDDANPSAFDCSELIQWGCGRLGIKPVMPDGSWLQARHCQENELMISLDEALLTPGALLFRFSSDPFTGDRPTSAHVALSQGNGRTIEARGTDFGVGQFSVVDRGWTHAGLVPGVAYEGEEDAGPKVYLTRSEQQRLKTLLDALEDTHGFGAGFPKRLLPWFRKWEGFFPEDFVKR
jgi:hypothetical protein